MEKSIDNWRSTGMLDDMEERAKRHLDGMTVNRDAMANDVLSLIAAIRLAQSRAAKDAENLGRACGFAGTFDDIFSGIFGKK